MYALCLPGALIAMLSPSWQRLPVWNLMHLHSYSVHVLLILYPVLLLAGGFRPQMQNIRKVLEFLVCTATPIFFLNRLIGTNFFFFLNDPNGNVVTVLFAHCFGARFYLLGFFPLIGVILVLLYLPWYRIKRNSGTPAYKPTGEEDTVSPFRFSARMAGMFSLFFFCVSWYSV